MRREFLVLGIILALIGVLIFFLGIVKVPYATTESVEVPKSEVVIDESFTVPALSHVARSTTFYLVRTLHITFTVTSGGNRDIDFRVMDEVNYWKFRADESYEYYTAVTRTRVSSVDIEWVAPLDTEIFFVWDNSFSWVTSKSISVYFYSTWTEWEDQRTTEYRTLFPTEASYVGVLLLIVGNVTAGYGLASKPSLVTPKTIEETSAL